MSTAEQSRRRRPEKTALIPLHHAANVVQQIINSQAIPTQILQRDIFEVACLAIPRTIPSTSVLSSLGQPRPDLCIITTGRLEMACALENGMEIRERSLTSVATIRWVLCRWLQDMHCVTCIPTRRPSDYHTKVASRSWWQIRSGLLIKAGCILATSQTHLLGLLQVYCRVGSRTWWGDMLWSTTTLRGSTTIEPSPHRHWSSWKISQVYPLIHNQILMVLYFALHHPVRHGCRLHPGASLTNTLTIISKSTTMPWETSPVLVRPSIASIVIVHHYLEVTSRWIWMDWAVIWVCQHSRSEMVGYICHARNVESCIGLAKYRVLYMVDWPQKFLNSLT